MIVNGTSVKRIHFQVEPYRGVGFGLALAVTEGGNEHHWNAALVLPFVGFAWWFWRRPVAPWSAEFVFPAADTEEETP